VDNGEDFTAAIWEDDAEETKTKKRKATSGMQSPVFMFEVCPINARSRRRRGTAYWRGKGFKEEHDR